jgi:hypothetical protein
MAKVSYRFQVTESVRGNSPTPDRFRIVKTSDGWTGGVDAITTVGKMRRISSAGIVILRNLSWASGPGKRVILSK